MLRYTMTLLPLSELRLIFESYFSEWQRLPYLVREDEKEHLYEWLIRQHIHLYLSRYRLSVHEHYRHDIYCLCYEKFYIPLSHILSPLIQDMVFINLEDVPIIKVMALGDTAIVARSISQGL